MPAYLATNRLSGSLPNLLNKMAYIFRETENRVKAVYSFQMRLFLHCRQNFF